MARNFKNLTSTQEREADEAISSRHIDNLHDIITDLDNQLTEANEKLYAFKRETGFETAEEFAVWFEKLKEKVENL